MLTRDSDISEIDLRILSLRRQEAHQDKIVDAFKHYVINEKSPESLLAEAAGYQIDGNLSTKFDLIFSALNDAHRQTLKQWLLERLKTPSYYPSLRLAKETYSDSAKAGLLPAIGAAIVAGPVALTVGVVSLFHQGKAQLNHRIESNARAQLLIDALNKYESFTQKTMAELTREPLPDDFESAADLAVHGAAAPQGEVVSSVEPEVQKLTRI